MEGSRVNPELDNTMQSDKFQDDDSEQNVSTPITDMSGWDNSTSATYFTSQSMLHGNTAQSECDVDPDRLFSIGRDITSPDPSIQLAAIHNAMSVIGQVNAVSPLTLQSRTFSSSESGHRSFSDMPYPHPPST